MSTPNGSNGIREITYGEAIREAIAEEMRRDQRVFVIGEDVAEAGTAFKVLLGLVDEFGPQRVIDSPISEPGITGLGVGAAMTGMRPVVDIMFGDFATLIMDQMVNQAAKTHYMSGGKLKVPMVLRTTLGSAILLGLEVLVAADLIRTITSKPSMEEALILGVIVLIRTVLSLAIQIEIEGVLPWRRALMTNGGQLLTNAVARDRAASQASSQGEKP